MAAIINPNPALAMRGFRSMVFRRHTGRSPLQFACGSDKGLPSNDRSIVMAALSRDGFALQFVSKQLREDRGVVLQAAQTEAAHGAESLRLWHYSFFYSYAMPLYAPNCALRQDLIATTNLRASFRSAATNLCLFRDWVDDHAVVLLLESHRET
jgi:hypothetical protein